MSEMSGSGSGAAGNNCAEDTDSGIAGMRTESQKNAKKKKISILELSNAASFLYVASNVPVRGIPTYYQAEPKMIVDVTNNRRFAMKQTTGINMIYLACNGSTIIYLVCDRSVWENELLGA